jgi:outer membrane receptor for ferrienterochelin and colicins
MMANSNCPNNNRTSRLCTILLSASALSLALTALAPSTAYAQSIDYGALEQLFGESVTTSATGSPQRATDVPANMEIITADDIRRSGADNIPDILKFVSGLDVRRYGVATAEVAIRGYSQPPNPRLLVMVNGRQVYLDDYGYVAWSTIPVQLDEIRQIEVVKGPSSALFGFNAASGVINIITYDPLKDDTGAVTLRTGTQSLREGSAVATFRIGDTAGVRISAGGMRSNDFSAHGLSFEDEFFRTPPRNGALNLDARWTISPNVELMAEGSAVDSRTPEDLAGAFFDLHYRTNSLRLGAAADTNFGLMNFEVYRNQTHTLYHSLLFGDEPLVNNVYVAKTSDLVRIGVDNTIRLGLEYRDNSVAGRDYSGRVGYNDYAGDVMWNWNMTPTLSLTNAVRVDELSLRYTGTLVPGGGLSISQYNNATITALSFNSGLTWKPSEMETWRLTAARGVEAPSLDDFGVQLPGIPASIGSPDLRPTSIWNMGLNYDRAVPTIDSLLRMALFAQRNDNLLGSNFFATPTVLPSGLFASQAQNIGSSDEFGLEIGIKGSEPSGFRWNASYAFASVNDRIRPDVANLAFSYAHATPQHTLILGGGYSTGKWEFDVEGKWQSEFQDYTFNQTTFTYVPVNIGDFFTLNLRIAYAVTNFLTAAVTVQQLNQSRIQQTNGLAVERQIIFSATTRF